jgi:hypothetical protein
MTKSKATAGNRKLYTRSLTPPFFILLDQENFNVSINRDSELGIVKGAVREFKPETTISELNAIIEELIKLSQKKTREASKLLN